MPHLDFLTLYIVIFLISLTMTVVWAGFAYTYRPHSAARHWLAACVLSLVGGVVLSIQGNEGSLVPAIVGNVIIIFGFSQFWIGLRRFRNMEGGQLRAVGLTVLAALAMVAMHDNDRGRAMVYSAGQATVMLVCIVHLLRNRIPGIGTAIALTAFAVAMLGQLMVVGSNWAVLSGALDFAVYYSLASYALLCTIFSATVWNLGFAMMTIDKLVQNLSRLSQTDELTGLANRRAFNAGLEATRRKSEATGLCHCVILADLNDFKALNDRFGHGAGDRALGAFGGLLRACAGDNAVVARLGGDEFCILLPETTIDQAGEIAAAIRARIAATPVDLPGAGRVALSASIGVAAETEASSAGVDLLSLADRRLYADKARHKSARPDTADRKLVLVS